MRTMAASVDVVTPDVVPVADDEGGVAGWTERRAAFAVMDVAYPFLG